MKRSFLVAIFIMAVTTIIKAGPADPSQRKTIKLDDGTKRVVQLIGDEFGHCWKSLNGDDCYREKPGEPDRYIEVSEQEMRQTASARRSAAERRARDDAKSRLGYPCTKIDLKGNKRVLTLLVEFQDKTFPSDNANQFFNVLNAPNYKEDNYHGSVNDYFMAQSNNQLDLYFDIVGPVKVSQSSDYYGKDNDTQNDVHASEMVSEALALVDDKTDFSQYDWDGDGTVEMILVIFAGMDQSSGGIDDDIWAHKGSAFSRYDNVYIDNYACAPELRMINDKVCLNSIGTICHELSHCFGLPDTYDQSTGNYGTDRWDIMGLGVHNNNGFTPAGYTAYNKMYCLWQTPIILRENQTISDMQPMSEGGNFYLIPNDAWGDEFYLLENRQQTGWDSKLPGHGMLIMHVDYDEELFYYNIVNRTGTISSFTNNHERMGLVLADNNTTIDNSNYAIWQACLQGDLYPFLLNNSLTNTSTPNTRLYHKNIDDTYLLSKPVTNSKENGDGTMSFLFTNDLVSKAIYHLSASDGRIQFVSDKEVRLVVNIKNDGYHDYTQKVGAFIYIKENDLYKQQEQSSIQNITLSVGESRAYEFSFPNLKGNTNYSVFLYYCKDDNADTWTQMGSGHPFNMSDRNKFVVTMDEEDMVIMQTATSASIEATFHNESYKKYTRYIGAYTYVIENGKYTIQEPKAFLIGNIEPYGDKRLKFDLGNMEQNVAYHIFFFYYTDASTNNWTQMSGPFKILVNDRTTDIIPEKIPLPQKEGRTFNLQGMEIDNPSRGIYIRNGKKMIIR